MIKKNIIINADDFGMSVDVNCEIVKLYKDKKIHRATIIVNAPCTDEAVRLALLHNIRVGLHFNFGEFPLISYALDDVKRNFWKRSFPIRIIQAFIHRKKIINEIVNQVELLRNKGVEIEHIDSHHHVHLRPELILHVIKACRISKISSVRGFRNMTTRAVDGSYHYYFKKVIKNILNYILRSIFGLKVTAYFGSLTDYRLSLQENINSHVAECIDVEIMVHPGNSSIGYPYKEEIIWLYSNQIDI